MTELITMKEVSLTVQAAVVVLPVGADRILLTHKHHLGHAHFEQPRPLEGTAHTEQLLHTHTRVLASAYDTHTRHVTRLGGHSPLYPPPSREGEGC